MRFFRGIRNKFLVIYLLFGLAPLLASSYHSFFSAAGTLERLSDQQLSNLTATTADQTSRQFNEIRKDIELLAGYPFIQLSFLQFSFGQRLETVRFKLKKYKNQNRLYSRISLIAPDGQVLLTVPEDPEGLSPQELDPRLLKKALTQDFTSSGVLPEPADGPLIIFTQRVNDFQNATEPVGLLVFFVHLNALTHFVEDLDPVPGTLGFVYDHHLGQPLRELPLQFQQVEQQAAGSVAIQAIEGFRIFTAGVPELNWTLGLMLPEDALLGDIVDLRRKSLSMALTIAILALVTSLFFVRRITQPIAELTRGAQAFSTGDLDHRIVIRGEGELRRLGEEFNAMADRLKARERQLRQVDRLASLGILAAGVAHEVRNPLAGIKSCSQLMQRKAIAPEVAVLAQGINEEIDRLDKIVRDLLEFARPGEANPVLLDLQEPLKKALEMTRKLLEEQHISVKCEFSPTEPAWADSDQVRQIFLNLILNSAQAMQQGGHLHISLQQNGELTTTRVVDTGCGIPGEHLERIFDPFFTLQPGGTGLGLSVVHSLMLENGIGWEVESEPGIGTRFSLHFSNNARKV